MSMSKEAKKDAVEPEARLLRRELFTDEMLDQLMAATDERGLSLTGQGGFLPEMIKAVLERGMEAELTGTSGTTRATRPVTGRVTPATGRRRRRSAPRSAISPWTSRGIGTRRSPRRWYPRALAAWVGWRT